MSVLTALKRKLGYPPSSEAGGGEPQAHHQPSLWEADL